uniref:Transmembrane protein n=1 Tax=Steinernema glaseri TaxID=37863 RepID=A0A1I7YBU6_9BILA
MPARSLQEHGVLLSSPCSNASTLVASPRSHDHSSLPEIIRSTLDRWPTREEFERNLRKVLLIAPFTRHRCCLGCIALDDAVLLICVFQLIQLAVLSLVGAQLALSDGYLFYTTALEGHGSLIASVTAVFVFISILIVSLTLYAWTHHKPRLYLFQIIWQIGVVCTMIGTIKLVFAYIKSPTSTAPEDFQIIWPSAFVVIFFLSISALIQMWWIAVMVDAFFNQYRKTEHLGRTIAIVVPGLLRYPKDNRQCTNELATYEI